mmetsp:Transcript_65235/g.108346  ORF Transcript_65235/g.108346 Transcript_65235/m.108346 type:complete len:211 (-) Transcript_65235:880-1512(-)
MGFSQTGTLLTKDHLIEAVDLGRRAEASCSALINTIDLDVEARGTSGGIRGLTPSLLNKQGKWRNLESNTQLGGGSLGCWISEHPHFLGEALVHIGHKAASVAQGVLVFHPIVHEAVVTLVLLAGTEVCGGENLGLLLDLDLLARGKPLVAFATGELVHSIIARDKRGSTWAIEHDDRGHLVTTSGAKHAGGLVPNADDGADSPVVVNNR